MGRRVTKNLTGLSDSHTMAIQLPFSEHPLCTKHSARCFLHVISARSHDAPPCDQGGLLPVVLMMEASSERLKVCPQPLCGKGQGLQ